MLTPERRLEIGVRMREQREILGFSAEEVGIGAGYYVGIITAVESGEKAPSANLLFWLAKAGADITFVLTGRSLAIPSNCHTEALRASVG